MDFELSEEQAMIRDTVAAFAREEIRPSARIADESGEIPAELIMRSSQLSLTRGWLPEKFGGEGNERSAITGAIIAEELAFGDLATSIHLMAPRLVAFPVLEMGSDEQRNRHLRRFASPDFVSAAAALIEPAHDFDLLSLKTTGRRDGRGYVLDGIKCLVPLANESEELLIYASIADEPDLSGTAGFLVNRATPGLSISEREKNMGLKGLATYEVTLTQCRVGSDRRLGGEGAINFGRIASQCKVATVSMATGLARAAFEYARDYARERKAFGVPIASKQAIAFMLADMAIETDAMRLLGWEAAWRLDRGECAFNESSLAKQYASAAALKVADNAVQILGGHGYIRDHPVELWLRNARAIAIGDALAIV
ncbi:MAG: acyl-CoA dehydrogenase family protein [Candidatus Binataceae bacterium]